ncbi:hypothetical protein MKX08_004811 [Trichoderma sp. CBMAI-0020]|nr:hypothetical protein MKX08_004811 [Trichoderma sp. CBMAI-0020]
MSEITADAVQELLQMNKSIKWYMEEFVIHLPFQEPRAQEVSASLARYAALLIEALRLDLGAPDRNTLHIVIQVMEDAVILPDDCLEIGALRWEVLQNVDLWPGEAKPASVSVVRGLGVMARGNSVFPTDKPDSTSTFNILALTARPRSVDDIPHRLITKSIYDVVEKANTKVDACGGSTAQCRTTLTIVRPGSLDALKRELNKNQRYDVVHLDLHGKVEDHKYVLALVSLLIICSNADCQRAYALFINEIQRDAHMVPAEDLASLLSSHGIHTVILNACQSAVEGEGPAANLAKALIQHGIQTAIAMAYKVLDVTANLFVCSLYDQLLRFNQSPLLAVQAARQCLMSKRTKKTSYLTEVPLDDYLVPSVYIRDDDTNCVTSGLSLSNLEMLRRIPPELPPDRSVDIDVNLVGREGDLLMLETDLMLESCVTAIEGPPGVGKSALINSAAEWWKSTAFIDRVVRAGFEDLQSPECLIEFLNQEFGTDLTKLDIQLEDATVRGRRIRTKIKNVLAPMEPRRRGGARGNLPKAAKAKRETTRKSKLSMRDSRFLVIFDGVEACGPRKPSEPVLELMGYFLAVFRDAQVSLSASGLDPAQESTAPSPYRSFVVVTTRRMPEIAVLNPASTESTGAIPNTQQAQKAVRMLAPLDEDRALLLTRYILDKTNRHPDVRDWEGLFVRGQLGKLVQGNPLALKMLLGAFNPKRHNLVGFIQALLRGDRIRLGSSLSETNHDVSAAPPDLAQAIDDVRRLLHSVEQSSMAVQALYPFWAPFQLQTIQDYLSYIDLESQNDGRNSINRCAVFGDQELELLFRQNHELPGSNRDIAMTILQPFIDEGFAVVGKAVDKQGKSESDYITLHPLIPLLLRDESRKTDDAYNMARETAHDVMPKLFCYRIKTWPKQVAYWKKVWDSPRETLRWEFFDFLGATYRVLDMRSSILTINVLVDLAHITNKGLFWDAGRRPLMGGFWRAATDRMHQDGHDISCRLDSVPLTDSLLRIMGGTRGSRGRFGARMVAEIQAKFLGMQHALSAELAEMAFCLSLVDYNMRQDEDAARKWFVRLKETYHHRTKVPGADSRIRLMFDDLLKIMEASYTASSPTQNFSDKQMAVKAHARKTIYKNLARTGFDISGYDAGAWKAAALRDGDGDSDDGDDDGGSHGMLGLGNSLLGRDEGVFVAILLARRQMKARPSNIAEARRLLYKAFSNDLEVGESPANAAYIHRALSEIVEERAARQASGQATETVKNEEDQRDYWRRALYHWEQALQVESDAGFEKSDDQVRKETARTMMLKGEVDGIQNALEADSQSIPTDPSSSKRDGKRSWNPWKSWAASRAEKRALKAAEAQGEVEDAQAAQDSKGAIRKGKAAESKAGEKKRGMKFWAKIGKRIKTRGRLAAEAELSMMQLQLMALGPLERRKTEPEPEPEPQPHPKPEPGPVNPKPSRARRPQQHLSEEEIADAKEKFSLISKNGEYITPKDMAAVFRIMDQPRSDQEIQDMIEEADTTGRGVVDFEDFLSMGKPDPEEELKEAFKVFDVNNDGFISPEDLRHCMRLLGEKMTDDEVDEMIREGDLDGDGRIDYQEFVQMMRGATD